MSGHLPLAFLAEEMAGKGYAVTAGAPGAVMGGAADSRKVRPGDLFVAFPGERSDGNAFVAQAFANGAVAAICSRMPDGTWPDRTIVVAPDTTRAVGELALAWRIACNPKVVGITGTVGKTTAKELCATTLAAHFSTHRSEGNFNSRQGLPLALMGLRTDHDVAVLEMAMDSRGEIAELCEIARPDVGVVLNVGLTHIEKLGSIEAIQAEKLTLPRSLVRTGTAVLNADDPLVACAIPDLACRVLTFGDSPAANIRLGAIDESGLGGTVCEVTHGETTLSLRSPLPGRHTLPAALASIGVGLALGLDFRTLVGAVSAAYVEGRMHVLRGRNGATIIDDRYNASPASVAGALDLLGRLPGRRIALLGKMAELGAWAEQEHRAAGKTAAGSCDILVSFGDLGRVVADAARAAGLAESHWFTTREEAAEFVAAQLRPGDTVLVKGSRSEALEDVLGILGGSQ